MRLVVKHGVLLHGGKSYSAGQEFEIEDIYVASLLATGSVALVEIMAPKKSEPDPESDVDATVEAASGPAKRGRPRGR